MFYTINQFDSSKVANISGALYCFILSKAYILHGWTQYFWFTIYFDNVLMTRRPLGELC